MTTTTSRQPAAHDDVVVLAYPGNQLKGQVRSLESTQSAFTVIKETFFSGK
ncbi:hypothetical protein [Mesorhizobium sp. CAU 1732]|uniref:hypothetical protein n=1 Tax=Mesorhizobium sp. CAU 1732 TaxID=3140358 RepID=UPI00326195CD